MTDTPRIPSPDDDTSRQLPVDRYTIREGETGERHLGCREAPTVQVVLEAAAVSGSTARGAPPGTIFLDGAAQAAPFMDTERNVHNLDHHEGCVRSFTLATCEQALVLVLKGFDLRDRTWTLRASEPDLDTVLALWVLLNHMRLGSDPRVRQRAIPLLRLEGVIDAHGLELQELTGFPEEFHRETMARLEGLRRRATALGRSGPEHVPDLLERTALLLREVDAQLYRPGDFGQEAAPVEELARAELPDGALVVACSSEESIYLVEQTLRWLYGDRLAVIVLYKDARTVTLRQVAPFLPATLEAAYGLLNRVDPAAGAPGSGDRWGGSAEIGGSPRGAGTGLSPEELVGACARALRRPGAGEQAMALVRGTGTAVLAVAAAWTAWGLGHGSLPHPLAETSVTLVLTVVTAVGLALAGAHRRRGLYGLRGAGDGGRWPLLPVALFGGVFGGALLPGPLVSALLPSREAPLEPSAGAWTLLVVTALALPAVGELLFRGLVQGLLDPFRRPRSRPSRWLPAPPVVTAALLSASVPAVLAALLWRPELVPGPWAVPAACGGALLIGLACGLARQGSESVLPPIAFHLLAALAGVVTALLTS